MNPLSKLFANPAVKILERQLWEDARKRYLVEHPAEQNKTIRTIARRTRLAYRHEVQACIREEDGKIRSKWHQFKHEMSEELRTSFATMLRMSEVDWYAVEAGKPSAPDAIAAPYELLKRGSGALLYQVLREKIEFEDLSDNALRALASYAADEKFEEIVEHARKNREAFKIGNAGAWFVLVELSKNDLYFIQDDKHHSRIDMVILRRAAGGGNEIEEKSRKIAVKAWLHEDRKHRANDRRFSPDGWEIDLNEFKTWTIRPYVH